MSNFKVPTIFTSSVLSLVLGVVVGVFGAGRWFGSTEVVTLQDRARIGALEVQYSQIMRELAELKIITLRIDVEQKLIHRAQLPSTDGR